MAFHRWNDEEKEYLKEITPGRHYNEIHQLMIEKFDYAYSYSQIAGAIKRYGLKTGFNGRFEKGHIPANKGTKGVMKANKTSFRKGHVAKNKKPVGSERINVEGYTEIKVAEPSVWRLKSRVLYEEFHNIKLNSNESIIFADGNKRNLSKDNLVLVTREELLKLNTLKLIKNDAELTKTGINIVKLIIKAKKSKEKIR